MPRDPYRPVLSYEVPVFGEAFCQLIAAVGKKVNKVDAFVGISIIITPVGRGSSNSRKLSGALTAAARVPSFIPSFFASGVPEYPAVIL